MTDPAAHLARLVELWHGTCADFVSLTRSLPEEQGDLPTDLAGWSVRDNVAHTAHLEAVCAGSPEETVHVDPAPHLLSPMSYYTEQGVLARRGRTLAELADEIEQAVARRYAALQADPPTDPQGSPPRTPGDIGWSNLTLLSNRPLDIWMHEQDVRRAVDLPGDLRTPVAEHVIGTFARSLPMLLGKRVGAAPGTSVRLRVGSTGEWAALVGDDGRAAWARDLEEPTATVTLDEQDYVVLSGGRRGPESVAAEVHGDETLGHRLLAVMAVTP